MADIELTREEAAALEDELRVGKGGSNDLGGEGPGTAQADLRTAVFKPAQASGVGQSAGLGGGAVKAGAGLEAGFEDGPLDILTAGGPATHAGGIGAGVTVPDGPNREPGNRDRTDQAGFEDGLTLPFASPTGQGIQQTSHPGVYSAGFLAPGPRDQSDHNLKPNEPAGYEDELLAILDPDMAYMDGKVDGDGNEPLKGLDIKAITFYEKAIDQWGQTQSSGNGFYGASSDGTLYWDGEPTGFADFGTLALDKKAWAGEHKPLDNGSMPTHITQTLVSPDHVTFQSVATLDAWQGSWLASFYRWYIEGDFDIEVSWENYAMAGGTDGGFSLEVGNSYSNYAYVRRRTPGSDRVDSSYNLSGAWQTYTSVATSVTGGKFRITRTGSTWRRYYDIGSGWVQIGPDAALGTDRVWVRVGCSGTGGVSNLACTAFGVTINTGTISNKIGWCREGLSSSRGSLAAFPGHALIVNSTTALSIIDADTGKLWMRFDRGAETAIPYFGVDEGQHVRTISMSGGVLFLGMSDDPAGTDNGGGIWIDFNLDWIRMHRAVASTITGGDRKSRYTDSNWGRDRAIGSIIDRNGAYGWGNDHDDWAAPAYRHWCTDLHHASGFQYRAMATSLGTAIFKWRRWYLSGSGDAAPDLINSPQSAASNEAGFMYWCEIDPSNLQLLYMDAANMYSVDSATYELRFTGAFGGMWDADNTEALPGTWTLDEQQHAVLFGTDLYLPRDEGIYRMSWPSGTWTLLYGKPGSGATYEVLPDYELVARLAYAKDGVNDLLLATLEHKSNSILQMVAIRLSGATLFSSDVLQQGFLDSRALVADSSGASAKIYHGSWLGVSELTLQEGIGSTAPKVTSAVATDKTHVKVTYDLEVAGSSNTLGPTALKGDSALAPAFNTDNYVLINDVTMLRHPVLRVKKLSATEYELTVMPMDAVAYTVTVLDRVEDLYGNPLDAANDSASFTGIAPAAYPAIDALFTFAGMYGGMDAFGENNFLPDVIPPSLANQNPAPGQTAVPKSSNISLDVLDLPPSVGLDEASVVLTVEGVIAWQNDSQQNGFAVTKTAVANGFNYDIDPSSDFAELQLVQVGVYAEDNEVIPNVLNTSYEFTTFGTAPELQNQVPLPGAIDADAGSNIVLEIVDPETGVDPAATILLVNGVTAYSGEASQNGFVVARSVVTGGYKYDINPPSPLPGGAAAVGVTAKNLAEVQGVLSTSYGFSVFVDPNPPQVVNIEPLPGAEDVLATKAISFSISDDVNVDLSTVIVWVRDTVVYNGSTDTFATGYAAGSSQQVNSGLNGFDFFILPNSSLVWEPGEKIAVRVFAKDSSGLSVDSQWFFTAGGVAFPFSVDRFIIRSIREMDRRSPGLIELMMTLEGGINDIWKDKLIQPQIDLLTLLDPNEIDARWLPWLKSIVGFTRDLSFQATELELRSIITNAVKFWSRKPSEPAVEDAIRMVTGNRFKIRNFFDFRMQVGTTYVTETLSDFDPNVLDFVSDMPSGNDLQWCDAGISFPCTHNFWINDLPAPAFSDGLFRSADQYTHLQITEWQDDPTFERTYEIDYLLPGTNIGYLKPTALPGPNSNKQGKWRLLGANSEYTTEVRLVDEPSGFGAVNRSLMKFLMNLVRAFGERIDVVYIDFLDQFITPTDLEQWSPSTSPAPTVPSPGGRALIPAGGSIVDNSPFSGNWGEQTTAFKVEGGTTSTELHLKFLYQDASNYYFVKLEYSTKTISLWKQVVGTSTQLGSGVMLPTLVPGFADVVRIDIASEGSGYRLRVKYNGDEAISINDTTFPGAGKVGVASTALGAEGYVHLVEVMTIPTTVDRVGPTP